MRIRDDRAQDEPEINLVPLIDVILVLIIFFVITTTFDARSTCSCSCPAQPASRSRPARALASDHAEGRYLSATRSCCAPTSMLEAGPEPRAAVIVRVR